MVESFAAAHCDTVCTSQACYTFPKAQADDAKAIKELKRISSPDGAAQTESTAPKTRSKSREHPAQKDGTSRTTSSRAYSNKTLHLKDMPCPAKRLSSTSVLTEASKRHEFVKLDSDTMEVKRTSDDWPILTQRTLRFNALLSRATPREKLGYCQFSPFSRRSRDVSIACRPKFGNNGNRESRSKKKEASRIPKPNIDPAHEEECT